MFDPFYRGADAAGGARARIVRAIANAHHAEIQVGSGGRGGTVIRITFRGAGAGG